MPKSLRHALAALAAAAGLSPAPAFALGLFVGSDAGPPGATVSIDVSIADGTGVSAIQAAVDFDPAVLTFISATPANVGGSTGACSLSPSPTTIDVSANSGAADAPLADGIYCTITFAIRADAPATGSALPTNITVCTAFDGMSTCAPSPGLVLVESPEYDSTPAAGQGVAIATVPGVADSSVVAVDNLGFANLLVTPQPMALPFTVSPTTQQIVVVDAPTPLNVVVECLAPDAGIYNGNLVIDSDDPNEPTNVYPVACTVDGPEVEPAVAPGTQLVMATTAGVESSIDLDFTNVGTQTLSISPSGLSAPFTFQPAITTPVAANAALAVSIRCNSATPGVFTQNFSINTTDANEATLAYSVQCTVTAPEVDAAPPPGALQITTPPGVPATVDVTISNLGDADLEITPPATSAPISVSPAGLTTIPANGQAVFAIGCAAGAAGSFQQQIAFGTSDADEPSLAYDVQCDVVAPDVQFTPPPPGPIALTTVLGAVGSANIDVFNAGTADLTFSITDPGAPFLATPGGSVVVAPGATQAITVQCQSAIAGNFGATLEVTTSDPDTPTATFDLSCAVNAPRAEATPPPGTLTVTTVQGADGFASIQVRNVGSASLTLTPGGVLPPFTGPTGSSVLAVGDFRNFDLTCGAGVPGSYSTPFSITTDDPLAPSLDYTVDCTVLAPGQREIQIVAGDGQSGDPGTQLAQTLVVRLVNPALPSGAPSGIPVSFAVVRGDAVFTPNGGIDVETASDGNGLAGVDVSLGRTPGPVQITASAPQFGSVTFNLVVRAPTRNLVKIAGDQQIGRPNEPGQDLVVALTANGQPLAGETIVWRQLEGGVAVLDGDSSLTDVDGRAHIGVRFGATPGDATIEASDTTGLTVRFGLRSDRETGAPTLTVLSGDGQEGAIGTLADAPVVFVLRDGQGAPIANAALTFAVVEGAATPVAGSDVTDAEGRAELRLRYGDRAGPVSVRVTALGGAIDARVSATVFASTLLIVSGDGQRGEPGSALEQPLVVRIAPAGARAKGLGGASVAWSVLEGGGTLAATASTTADDGSASNALVLGPAAGVNRVQASVPGVGSVVFTATATLPATARLEALEGGGQRLVTGAESAPLVVRAVTDAGAPIAGVRIRWSSDAPGIQLSADEGFTASDGQTRITVRLAEAGAATVRAEAVGTPLPAVQFVLNGGIANLPGLDDDAQGVAGALDLACPALNARAAEGVTLSANESDLRARCNEIAQAGDDPAQAGTAIEELLADETGAQNNAILTAQAAQFANLKSRLAALRSGSAQSGIDGLALQTADGTLPLSFLPSSLVAAAAAAEDGGEAPEAGAEFARWGFFATGTIGQGDRDRQGRDPGFDFDTWNLTAGVDYRVSDRLILGTALGYTRNDTEIGDDQGGIENRGWSLSGYGSWYSQRDWYVDGVLSWGRNQYDLARRVRYQIDAIDGQITRIDQLATASPDGDQSAFALSVGRDVARGAWNVGPYLRATWTRVDFDAYVERMSDPGAPGGGLALRVDERSLESLEGVLGGKLTYTMSTSWGVLLPHISLEWLHEFEDDPEALVTRFASDPTGTPIAIATEVRDRSYFNLGLGLSGVFANGRSAYVYYERRAGQSGTSMDNLAIGVRLEF